MTITEDAPTTAPLEIGTARTRKEDQRLITGRTRWTDNIVLPGMLHMAMVRSPFAHANITNIDTSEAKTAPNVLGVFTGADLGEGQGVLINALGHHDRPEDPGPPADPVRPGLLRRRDRRRRRGPLGRRGP